VCGGWGVEGGKGENEGSTVIGQRGLIGVRCKQQFRVIEEDDQANQIQARSRAMAGIDDSGLGNAGSTGRGRKEEEGKGSGEVIVMEGREANETKQKSRGHSRFFAVPNANSSKHEKETAEIERSGSKVGKKKPEELRPRLNSNSLRA